MLKVKIKSKRSLGVRNSYIEIDNVPDHSSFYEHERKRARFSDDEVIKILQSHSFAEISSHFNEVFFLYNSDWWDNYLEIEIYFNQIVFPSQVSLQIELKIDPDLWSAGWSVAAFSKALKTETNNLNNKNIKYYQSDEEFAVNGFGLVFLIHDLNTESKGIIDTSLNNMVEIIQKTNRQLISSLDNETLVSFFNFPESIKTSCQQYLMYFAQFLKDLDIEVETEIKEQARSTLFKVIPKDKGEALDKIKEALDTYINAPALTDLEFQNMGNNDISFIQFQANVMHLKSQIMFANATLQLKNATIETLQLSIYQLKNQLNSNDISVVQKKEETEIISGIVSLKKFDGKWFSINLPEILNRLKRRFDK